MSQLVVYVQDANLGIPAAGVQVTLERRLPDGRLVRITGSATGADGCIEDLLPDTEVLAKGVYRIVFETRRYFEEQEISPLYDNASIEFHLSDASQYVLPLLLTPCSYTVYRGS